jgi:hypothetical protein
MSRIKEVKNKSYLSYVLAYSSGKSGIRIQSLQNSE